MTRLIVEKLLLEPTEQLKALPDEETQVAYTEAVNRLFRLRDEDGSSATGADALTIATLVTAPFALTMETLRLGTRGSELALFQANAVAATPARTRGRDAARSS